MFRHHKLRIDGKEPLLRAKKGDTITITIPLTVNGTQVGEHTVFIEVL